ncbi:MAG: hypothetical protein AVDCRST_MAG56-3075 [uncultured Cytophagales bacterium]|uniref:Uncharacterized protein n=1 Tax=uncultured Cytophagales bacterium TaxID=158755 RepID=A0A6J4J8H4_9SPHI|nr:MAG: hypothetical protein AVDCRST_MAG56-3075 [uncultured Cytophagales bacterium]
MKSSRRFAQKRSCAYTSQKSTDSFYCLLYFITPASMKISACDIA